VHRIIEKAALFASQKMMRSKQKHALQNIHLYTTLYTIPDTDHHHQTAARYIATATQTKIESNHYPDTFWDTCLY